MICESIVKDGSRVFDNDIGKFIQGSKNSTAGFPGDEFGTWLSDEDGKGFSPDSSGLLW